MAHLSVSTHATIPLTICASHRVKLIGSTDGLFPDIGHHSEREMAGLWMHPIKLLDGFWLRFHDLDAGNVNTWIIADQCVQEAGGNRFLYRNGLGHTSVTIDRIQLAPDEAAGLIVDYLFTNHAETPRRVELEWRARTDLYPSWYALDAKLCQDGVDEGQWDARSRTFYAKDGKNPWYALIASDPAPDQARTGRLRTPQGSGRGTCLSLMFRRVIAANGTLALRFYVTGSHTGCEEAEASLRLLRSGIDFGARKEERMANVIDRAALTTGDPTWDLPWALGKAHLDWLILDAGAYGAGLAAGLPEYPWWFGCDSCYAIQGLLCVGQFEWARKTLKLLVDYSARVNGNGRVVHEITPFGLCPNPGNTQETAHFVTAVWHYWQATGDSGFVLDMLPFLEKSMQWLQSQDEDGDLLPSGYGIIEIRGLNAEMIDTAAYTCQAWECYAEMLALAGRAAEAATARETHQRAKRVLNTVMWDEDAGLYCDACASPGFVMERLDQILAAHHAAMLPSERAAFEAKLAAKQTVNGETGFLINRNWVIATPMESGQAEPAQARRALREMYTERLVGPWGVYLSAADHEHIMTISTGCLAVALARWGCPDQALELLSRMLSTFSQACPGMISEMSPDYGCVVQAWTAYALYVPVVRYFFGVQPAGRADGLCFSPCMPGGWRHAELRNVRVPGGLIHITFERVGDTQRFTLSADHALRVRCGRLPGWACDREALSLTPGEEKTVTYTIEDGGKTYDAV